MKEDSHCSYCGKPLMEAYPKKCEGCGNTTWKNPIPVVVAIIPVWENGKRSLVDSLGVLLIRRSIEPKIGEWALPGGYMDAGEDWQTSCAREVLEEVGIETDPKLYNLIGVATAPTTGNLLLFTHYLRGRNKEDVIFVPNSEVSEIQIAYEPMELAFPTHTQLLQKYLKGEF